MNVMSLVKTLTLYAAIVTGAHFFTGTTSMGQVVVSIGATFVYSHLIESAFLRGYKNVFFNAGMTLIICGILLYVDSGEAVKFAYFAVHPIQYFIFKWIYDSSTVFLCVVLLLIWSYTSYLVMPALVAIVVILLYMQSCRQEAHRTLW